MNAYACTKCGWQYQVWTMGDRVKAVKRHQLMHELERHGRLNDLEDVVNPLMMAEGADETPGDVLATLVR